MTRQPSTAGDGGGALLTCPWCNGLPKFVPEQDGTWWMHHDAESCPVTTVTKGYFNSRAEAIAAWNNRRDARGEGVGADVELWTGCVRGTALALAERVAEYIASEGRAAGTYMHAALEMFRRAEVEYEKHRAALTPPAARELKHTHEFSCTGINDPAERFYCKCGAFIDHTGSIDKGAEGVAGESMERLREEFVYAYEALKVLVEAKDIKDYLDGGNISPDDARWSEYRGKKERGWAMARAALAGRKSEHSGQRSEHNEPQTGGGVGVGE